MTIINIAISESTNYLGKTDFGHGRQGISTLGILTLGCLICFHLQVNYVLKDTPGISSCISGKEADLIKADDGSVSLLSK